MAAHILLRYDTRTHHWSLRPLNLQLIRTIRSGKSWSSVAR